MVMDKYKPLRLPHDPEKNPADEKIKAGIQTPTSSSSPTTGEEEFQLFAEPGTSGDHEDGRKLPKTPDAKPWRAVYVRPAHLMGGKAAEDFQPSIYYGQFLHSSSSSSAPRESDIRTQLKSVGINPSTVPVDDPKALAKLRSSIATAQRRGKLLRARESVLDYQLSLPRQEMKGDEVSDVSSNLQLQLGHAQGWDSVIEKRIKQALSSPGFRENKLRGKPIQRDMEEKNPFLAREEYFMNRIVKRQGAAPAWVELNMELESEVSGWKGRLDEGWIRRASRMITTSSTLADGLEPFPLDTTIEPSDKDSGTWIDGKQILLPRATTPGSQRLLDVASRYRDAEWEARETSYHQLELKRLNDLIRKHNHLAPFTARKGLMVLDIELANMYARTLPKLVFEISSILRSKVEGEGRRKDGWEEMLMKEGGVVEYDVWGREVRREKGGNGEKMGKGWLDGWLGSDVGSRSGDAVGQGGQGGRGMDSGKEVEVQNLGLLAAIQKSLHWARQRIVGA
ncbi:hypothetical protein PHSY_000784 [Pseudozyma hubeiensis SY62]|uniref:DnaJ homologue subfamily C member 28 conserved domain-containing protein n=1 Tax=Pseudozyma hubeiensis (strain SY62) TaxID=1305764 RepID=R9NXC1_PSEHS|nr:hypothetical protein PHSY_000784 [Pseudozyma hubeiensis SY62]GAC93221.1 hypothetical protein PHSY_000784 [Pseudozyma hubeiensis SY62]